MDTDKNEQEPGRATRPALSVVLIVADNKDSPAAVISALQAQCIAAEVDYIVVDGRTAQVAPKPVTSGFKTIWIEMSGANMPDLKAAGARAAQGEIVAFLEPHGIPQPGWLNAIIETFGSRAVDALGGVVAFGAEETAANRAAFRFEYSAFSKDLIGSGQTRDLPGNNMAFRREILLELCGDILERDGLNKPFCQARFEDAGRLIELRTDMVVELGKQHTWRGLLRTRFSYARCFGCTRVRYASRGQKKWLYRLGAPLAPLLVLRKHISKVRLARGQFSSSLLLIALCLVWGGGEIAGYWFGCGRACTKLR